MIENVYLDTRMGEPALRFQVPTVWTGSKQIHASVRSQNGTIEWDAREEGITIMGSCTNKGDGLWYLAFHLENTGEDREVKFTYPYLFYHFDQEVPVRVFNPTFGGILETLPYGHTVTYPGRATYCLTAAAGNNRTVAVGLYNDMQRNTTIRTVPGGADGQFRFVLERILVRKGQRLALPVQFICIGESWAEAMQPYKQWLAKTFQPINNRPDWMRHGKDTYSETRKAHCVAPYNPPETAAGIWVFDNNGRPRTFEQLKAEIDDIILEGEEKGFKPLFYQFGWWKAMAEIKGLYMFDAVCGDYTQAHDTAKRIVHYIHQRGMKVYLYTNAIAAGDETEVFKHEPGLFVRDMQGMAVYNGQLPMLFFCPGAPGIRKYWEETLHYILLDMDADGIFLDQICGAEAPPFCYDPSHRHEHPDVYGEDILELIKFIRATAKEMKPDCYVGGELVLDSRSVLLDETHGYGYCGPASIPPEEVQNQRNTPPAEYYIFTRYLSPFSHTQIGKSEEDMMNGAAGHYAYPLWKAHREIFESGVNVCKVEPCGAVAYLFGPVDGKAILAVRSHGDIGEVRVTLPGGKDFHCNAGSKAQYYVIDSE